MPGHVSFIEYIFSYVTDLLSFGLQLISVHSVTYSMNIVLNLDTVVHTSNPAAQVAEARRSQLRGQHGKFSETR